MNKTSWNKGIIGKDSHSYGRVFSDERKKKIRNVIRKHGLRNTRFYKIWCDMKYRCDNKNHNRSHIYSKREIFYQKSWSQFIYFKNDMFESYNQHIKKYGIKNTTLDRIDNNKGYFSENCRWATQEIQQNNRRNNNIIEFNGEKMTISQWAKKLNISPKTIQSRIRRKYSLDQIFDTTIYKNQNHRKKLLRSNNVM